MISRIVSGGQTGADQGGLAAAIHCRLPHGGWCPKGRRTEDGKVPAIYELQETNSADYRVRTEANVVDSDCTVIFTDGVLEGGSLLTAECASKHAKPWLHIDIRATARQQAVDVVVDWLCKRCPANCVLNVAGQRGSKAPHIKQLVKAWMIDVISNANGKPFNPISDKDEDGGDAAPVEGRARVEAVPTLYHPKTIDQAVQIVIASLPPEQRAKVRGYADRDKFAADQHFGLAMGIRNMMINHNANLIDLLADFQRGSREGRWSGTANADSVSGVIVRLVWDRLRK